MPDSKPCGCLPDEICLDCVSVDEFTDAFVNAVGRLLDEAAGDGE